MHDTNESTTNQGVRGWSRLAVLLFAVLVVGTAIVLTGTTIWAQADTKRSPTLSNDVQVIHDFMTAFNSKDVDAIMEFFTEDAIYHNMPSGPVQGTVEVRNLITMFVSPAETVDWEILNIAQTGDTVLTERIDRFVIGGKDVKLPVMGAFDMKDGKIAAWRDYFDMATWQKQMAQ